MFDSVRGPLQSVSVLSFGGLSLPCSALVLSTLVWIILTWSVMFLVFWMVVSVVERTVDWDLLTVIEHMVIQRDVESVRISKVKGHADDDMVGCCG